MTYRSHVLCPPRNLVGFTFYVFLCVLCGFASACFSQTGMRYISYCEAPFSHWMFNTDNDTINGNWLHIASLNQPLYGVNCYYWQDSAKVFICGGADTLDVPQTACYFYDPAANTYFPKAPLPLGRALGKLVRAGDSLYLIGSVVSWH